MFLLFFFIYTIYFFYFFFFFFFFNDTATTEIYTLSLHDALPTCRTRSAEMPYSSASSCSVALSSVIQRRLKILRLRSSSFSIASIRRSLESSSHSSRSTSIAGSAFAAGRYMAGEYASSSSLSGVGSKDISRADNRCSISRTSLTSTPRSRATARVSSSDSHARFFFILRRLKNSLRCDLVVATLTRRQLRSTYSWISARIQWTAKDTKRTPTLG